jgi:hypothetical protein
MLALRDALPQSLIHLSIIRNWSGRTFPDFTLVYSFLQIALKEHCGEYRSRTDDPLRARQVL